MTFRRIHGGARVELPRGVTGFRHADEEPHAVCDMAAFRAHCFRTARLLHGRVHGIETPSERIINNFAICILELPEGGVAVVLNAHHPIVGFAEPPREGGMRLQFVEAPVLAEVFRSFGVYHVLEASQLNQRITDADVRRLGKAEIEQVRHWKPDVIGALLFNFWD